MDRKRLFFYITTLLFFCGLAYADDFVVPAIKAPYAINGAQWDSSGNQFAYEVNGKVYIRDSLSLVLKDSYAKNSDSDFSAFYKDSSKADYPVTNLKVSGNTVTISTRKTAGASIESMEIKDLPVPAKAAAVNKQKTHLAFLGTDGNAYIYDINGKSVTGKIPYNQNTSQIYFTKQNNVIIADSNKTAGIYSINGDKVRSFTNATSIRGLSLSPDEETLMIYDTNGTINFYNSSSSTQFGYIPNLGSRLIKSVELSKDSRKVLINAENNTLFAGTVQDLLFSPNTVAPTPKQFAVNYNALDPDQKDADVTEFGVNEYTQYDDNTNAEYITSTKEKANETQKFDLDKERKASEAVAVTQQPDQALFPSTLDNKDREVTFTDKSDVTETESHITEYKQPENYQTPLPQNEENLTVKTSPRTFTQTQTNGTGAANNSGSTSSGIVSENSVSGNGYANGNGSNGGNGNGTPTNIYINITGSGQESGSAKAGDTTATKETDSTKETAAAKTDTSKKAETAKKEDTAKKTETKEEKTATRTDKTPLEKALQKVFKMSEEDVVEKFKDGHGLVINAGFSFLPDPYMFDIRLPIGYRNYNLIRPCYFGGMIEPFIGIPEYDFPYDYKVNGGYIGTPKLAGIRAYAPIGFAVYPLKNSLELFAELDLGISFNMLMSGQIGGYFIRSDIYPSFYSAIKLGAAWDFIDLTICGVYDAMFGITFSAEIGVCINLGGSRNVGGSRLK